MKSTAKQSAMSFTTLISVDDLHQNLSEIRVFDCSFNLADSNEGEKTYFSEHIPSALYAHLDRNLSSQITPSSGRHPLPDFDVFIKQLGHWGLTPKTQVVVYDNTSGTYAARLWWLLKTVGHQNVAVLNGGTQAWRRAGFKLESESRKISSTKYVAQISSGAWVDAWVDVEQLQQLLNSESCVLIDARTSERFNGQSEPIDSIAGHIPGAVNQPLPYNLDANGCFATVEQLSKNYRCHVKDRDAYDVVHMCGSGVFACHAILAMEVAGLGHGKLYPGSWSEWIRDSKRAIGVNV